MFIKRLDVNGKLKLHYEFGNENILLGENSTGKSTFINLILYCLGVNNPNFIEEIAKHGFCEHASIDILTKSKKSFRVIRKLPSSDNIIIIPIADDFSLKNDDVMIYSNSEYSDFLLDEEGYDKQTISYGLGKTASLRFYFLLRALLVDQDTPHNKILANISGDKGGFIDNQNLIKKAIIEKYLVSNNHDVQKLRLEIQSKIREQKAFNDKLEVFKDTISKMLENDASLVDDTKKIGDEIQNIGEKKDMLTQSKYAYLLKIEQQNDEENEKKIIHTRNKLMELKEKSTVKKLEISDVTNIIDQLKNELNKIKIKLTAQTIITQIPVTICPMCFSHLTDIEINTGLCENCANDNAVNQLEQVAKYKRLIEESIIESTKLKEDYSKELDSLTLKIQSQQESLSVMQKEYFDKRESAKEPIENLISEIRINLEMLIEREFKLHALKKTIIDKNEILAKKKSISADIKALKEDLDDAEKKSTNEIVILNRWEERLGETIQTVSGTIMKVVIDPNDYMPIIDDITISSVSSASLKLMVQLSYQLSLFSLNNHLEDRSINHVGILLLDSPRDKDLDIDKYERYLDLLSRSQSGQVFLTGSITDQDSYHKYFPEGDFLPTLSDANKLLKDGNSHDYYSQLALSFVAQNQNDEAMSALANAHALCPENQDYIERMDAIGKEIEKNCTANI